MQIGEHHWENEKLPNEQTICRFNLHKALTEKKRNEKNIMECNQPNADGDFMLMWFTTFGIVTGYKCLRPTVYSQTMV